MGNLKNIKENFKIVTNNMVYLKNYQLKEFSCNEIIKEDYFYSQSNQELEIEDIKKCY